MCIKYKYVREFPQLEYNGLFGLPLQHHHFKITISNVTSLFSKSLFQNNYLEISIQTYSSLYIYSHSKPRLLTRTRVAKVEWSQYSKSLLLCNVNITCEFWLMLYCSLLWSFSGVGEGVRSVDFLGLNLSYSYFEDNNYLF